MHVTKIIPYRYWRNIKTGFRVGIHGAVPYHSDADKKDWEVVTRGFTQVWSNNTTRNNGPLDECKPHALRINLVRVHQLKEHARRYPETVAECKAAIKAIPVML